MKRLAEEDEAESSCIALAKQEEEAKSKERLVCAKNLKFEIQTRFDSLKRRCLSEEDLKVLNDYEVSNLKKSEESFHAELRELVEKACSFETFVSPCGETAKTLRDSVILMQDKPSRRGIFRNKN